MNSTYPTKRRNLYRSRHGVVLGVCRGIAEYFDISIKWTRILALIALVVTGFWPALAVYLLSAYLMRLEPILPYESELEEDFYNSYVVSKAGALRRVKQHYEDLNRRIGRMENLVVNREADWERRLNS